MTPVETNPDFRAAVFKCLCEFSPQAVGVEISDNLDTGKHLGIDSLMGVELACEFVVRFGVRIEPKDNPLVCTDTKGQRRMRTVGELVDHLSTLLAK